MFGFWCFNAGVGFKKIQSLKPRSVIMTSGTLSPLYSFEQELQVEFKQKLENPHVISAEQVNISILKRGMLGENLQFDYKSRDNPKMLEDLALSIGKVSEQVPGGILVFFPSYKMLNDCYNAWSNSGAIVGFTKHKKLVKEPRDSSQYQQAIDDYYSAIYEGERKGAIMMAVCRGRISEGLDFSDDAARMVIIVGIPFPQLYDARVILKRNYLDSRGISTYGGS